MRQCHSQCPIGLEVSSWEPAVKLQESILDGEVGCLSAGPTVEDLTLDDSLDDMRRIQRYARTQIPIQRLVHVRMMASTAQAFG